MSKNQVEVKPNNGMPEYPSLEKGEGEIVVHFGKDPLTNSFLDVVFDALALARDAYDRPLPGIPLVQVMIREAVVEEGHPEVVLPHQGAVALREALEVHPVTYGGEMASDVTREDIQSVIDQLPAA